jgi:hypothetical protein
MIASVGFLLDEGLFREKTKIPNVKMLGLSGDLRLFDILELSGIENLRFLHTGWRSNQMRISIPAHLTKLFLGSVKFSLSLDRPQYLPALKTLELRDVVFDSPVRRYLHCPELIELSYWSPKEFPVSGSWTTRKHQYKELVEELFDACFFRETPSLQTILFHGLTMDSVLVGILQSCRLLHTLRVENCRMKSFIPSFFNSITHKEHFPSLRIIEIDDSWSVKTTMSYEEFTKLCKSERSQIKISGNGRIETVSPPTLIDRDDLVRQLNRQLNDSDDSSIGPDPHYDSEGAFDPPSDQYIEISSDTD